MELRALDVLVRAAGFLRAARAEWERMEPAGE